MRQLKMVLIVGAITALMSGAVAAQSSGSPVQTKPVLARVSGRIVKIDPQAYKFALQIGDPTLTRARMVVFSVDRGTRITKDGSPAAFGDLYVGDLAVVAFQPVITPTNDTVIRAVSVDAKTPPELIGSACGRVVGIDPEKQVIAVLPPNVKCTSADPTACALFFQVTPITRIIKMGGASLEDLTIGDAVRVMFRKTADNRIPPALTITVMPNTFVGKVAKVDPGAGLIVIAGQNEGKLFKVIDKTRITLNGRLVPLKAILPGDDARVIYFAFDETNVAVDIAAKGVRNR